VVVKGGTKDTFSEEEKSNDNNIEGMKAPLGHFCVKNDSLHLLSTSFCASFAIAIAL
jgi:hypothetical protein